MGPAWAQSPLAGVLVLPVLWTLLSPACGSHAPPGWRFSSSEVVIPRKVPHRSDGSEMSDKLSYSIRFRGQRHVIHMKLKKDLVPRHFPVITDNDQGAMQEDYPFVPRDCYYYSYLEGVPGSMATLDTCRGGLRGMLQVDDFTYEIKPLEPSSKFEHVVSLLVSDKRAEERENCEIGVEDATQALEEVKLAERPRAGHVYLWRLHIKRLRLHYTISDSLTQRNRNFSTIIENTVIVNNILDSMFLATSLHVHIRMLCIWDGIDRVDLYNRRYAAQATSEFGLWKLYGFFHDYPHSTSVLFTGHRIAGASYHTNQKGICNPNWGVVYVFVARYHWFMTAAVTAHTIGHNFGMVHDTAGCVCFRRTNCIMAPVPTLIDMFSNCSYEVVIQRINGWENCLSMENVPYNNFDYISYRCGDKNITQGEECDCGSFKDCADNTCCETDCILTVGSLCDVGRCCRNCKYAVVGTTCRDPHGICDLPEYCDGKTENCPEDFYIQDGTPCSPIAVCMRGNCTDRHMQCQALFGQGVGDGPAVCYRLNLQGDRFGNCGIRLIESGSKPVPCERDDVLCGMLHCRNIKEIPGGGEHTTFHHLLAGKVGKAEERCVGFDIHHGTEVPEFGLVVDGASCGPGKYCLKQNCTFFQDLQFDCDVMTCNSRGVCNNKKHCHCIQGWKPPNCDQKGTGGSEDSGPAPDIQKGLQVKLFWKVNYYVLIMLIRILLLLFVIAAGGLTRSQEVVERKIIEQEYEDDDEEEEEEEKEKEKEKEEEEELEGQD